MGITPTIKNGGAAVATGTAVPGGSVDVVCPSGANAPAEGDYIEYIAGNDDNTTTAQFNNTTLKPTGFELINETGDSNADAHSAIFYKIADGTEGGTTINCPAQSSDDIWGMIRIWVDVDPDNPINVTGSDYNGGSATTHTPTQVTTDVDNCVAVAVMSGDGGDLDPVTVTGTGWAASGTGFTEVQAGTGTGNCVGCVTTKDMDSLGATGAPTFDWTGSASDGGSGFIYAIQGLQAGITSVTPSNPRMDEPNIVIAGAGFGTEDAPYISDATTTAGSLNEVDVGAGVDSWTDTEIQLSFREIASDYLVTDANILMDTERAVGQSFPGDGKVLSYARFKLSKFGSPTGDVTAVLYAHSGTYGTSSVATGSALATSKAIDASTLPAVGSEADFFLDFRDSDYTLESGTNYVIALHHATGTGSNAVRIARNDTSPTHGGNFCEYNGTTWSATSTRDLYFGVYTEPRSFVSSLHTLKDLDRNGPHHLIVKSTTDEYSSPIVLRRPKAFRMALSANFAPGGTTAQLTAPAGKTTGDMDGGRIEEALNPSATNTVVTADDYAEDEWCEQATSDARAVQYVHRVLGGGQVPGTITQSPKITISDSNDATAAQTLANLAQAATAAMEPSATSAQTLPSLTQLAAGAQVFEITSTQELQPVAQAAAAAEEIPGAGDQTLQPVSQAAGLTEEFAATVAQTLAAAAQTATAEEAMIGTGAQTLAPVVQAAVATLILLGTGAQTLVKISQAAAGDSLEGGPATGAQTLQAVEQAATVLEEIPGTVAQTLAAAIQEASAVMEPSGIGGQLLYAVVQSATASSIEGAAGDGIQALATIEQAATASIIMTTTAAQVLQAAVQAATGYMVPAGTGAQGLQPVSQAATAAQAEPVTATGGQTLAALVQRAIGVLGGLKDWAYLYLRRRRR